eukprot:152543_1
MACQQKKQTWALAICWILTLGALIPWIIIYVYYVNKYNVSHWVDPSENDLVLSTTEPNPIIITDVSFTTASIDCGTSFPTTYKKCTSGDNTAAENCESKSMCIATLTSPGISGSMGVAFEGDCTKCSNDIATERMAYSFGESRSRDDAQCFWDLTDSYPTTYLFCLPSFHSIYQKYVGLATALFVLSIIFGVGSIAFTVYVVYRKIKEKQENSENNVAQNGKTVTGGGNTEMI